jgi:membrane protease YdiL (CAAX protease family)
VGRKRLIGYVILGIVVSFLIVGLTQAFDITIKEKIFAWLPDWYLYDVEYSGYSKQVLLITGIARILVDGMIIPYIEEIYFRGYLLPRIKGKGLWVPISASALFAIYHFWQPWNYISLLIISAVLVFPAWYFKNYKISLYIHMAINLLGSILFLLMVMQ